MNNGQYGAIVNSEQCGAIVKNGQYGAIVKSEQCGTCLLYTSDAADES